MSKRLRFLLFFVVSMLLAGIAYPSLMRFYYRVEFEEYILAESRNQRISPHLVAAVIFVESRFRDGAVSEVGAQGLMQLMPETATEVSDKYGLGLVDVGDLRVPELNIRIGSAYLAELLRRFDDERDAIAAYNAGPSRVDEWRRARVETIPFPETKNFVEQVTKHRTRLQRLYPEW